jgi:release factor glutamine methyltransferase
MSATARLIDGAPAHLTDDGWLLIEVGTQAAEVRSRFEENGWRDVKTFRDLAGLDRVVAGRPPLR